MGNTINLQTLIAQQAVANGVPPQIALAVAQQESGTAQWTPNGNLVTGTSGEIGVFQLMPATAAGLGVDPTDVNQNIAGGVGLLAQLYQQYGNWPEALSAYNSGSPTGSPIYAANVLAAAGYNTDTGSSSGSTLPTVTLPSLPDLSDVSDLFDNTGSSMWWALGIGAALLFGLLLWES
jgi:soluble lytic murein transglycosylase-like protein